MEKERRTAKRFTFDIVYYADEVMLQSYLFHQTHPFSHPKKEQNQPENSIFLESLFDLQTVKFEKTTREIHRILLIGKIGTGKTSIVRSYATRWADGDIGRSFKAVYVLPMKDLNALSLETAESETPCTLKSAIARICFGCIPSMDDYDVLCNHLGNDLMQKTTLMIVDGLDKREPSSQDLVSEILQQNCKILITSRPHAIQEVLPQMDFKIEVLGLKKKHLFRFLSRELVDEADALIECLKCRLEIENAAQNPIIAHVVCQMWKNKGGQSLEEVFGNSRETLFHKMMHYFEGKGSDEDLSDKEIYEGPSEKESREGVFEALQKIAFDAQKNEQILIEKSVVQNYASEETLKSIFRNFGFLFHKTNEHQYQFLSLDFQKCFAGHYLARSIFSVPSFKGSDTYKAYIKNEAIGFITQHKYKHIHRAVLSSMVHKASENEISLVPIFDVLDQEPFDFIGIQQILLKLSVLDAFLSVNEIDREDSCTRTHVQYVVDTAAILLILWGEDSKLTEWMIQNVLRLPNTCQNFPHLVVPVMSKLELHFGDKTERAVQSVSGGSIVSLQNSAEYLFSSTRSRTENKRKSLRNFLDGASRYFEASSGQETTTLVRSMKFNVRNLLSAYVGSKNRKTGNRTVTQEEVSLITLMAKNNSIPALHARQLLVNLVFGKSSLNRKLGVDGMIEVLRFNPHAAELFFRRFSEMAEAEKTFLRSIVATVVVILGTTIPSVVNESFNVLLKLTEDKNNQIRESAGSGIVLLGRWVTESENALFDVLYRLRADKEWQIRQIAAKGMTELGRIRPNKIDRVIPELLALSDDRIVLVRQTAAQGIVYLSQHSIFPENMIFRDLDKLRRKENADVRRIAAEGIFALQSSNPIGIQRTFDALAELVDDGDPDVREAASKEMIKFGRANASFAQDVLNILSLMCGDNNWNVRQRAVEGVTLFSKTSAVSSLHAIRSLSKVFTFFNSDIRDERSSPFRMARNRWKKIKMALKVVVKKKRKDEKQGLDEDWHVRQAAANQIVELGKANTETVRESINILERLCFDRDSDVRRTTIQGWVILGTAYSLYAADAFYHLSCLATDNDLDVSSEAFRGIVALSKSHKDAIPPAFDALTSLSKANEKFHARQGAVTGIVQFAKTMPDYAIRARGLLFELSEDKNWFVREKAVEGIVLLWSAYPNDVLGVFSRLAKLCEDEDWHVRRTATAAMIRYGKGSRLFIIEVLDVLSKASVDKDPEIFRMAAHGVAYIGSKHFNAAEKASKLYFDLAYHWNYQIRQEAIKGHVKLSHSIPEFIPKTFQILLRLFHDKIHQVRQQVAVGIVQLAAIDLQKAIAAKKFLSQLSKDPIQYVRQKVAQMAVELTTTIPESIRATFDILSNLMNDKEKNVRQQAAEGMIQLGKFNRDFIREVFDILAKRLGDETWLLRQTAANGIVELVHFNPESIEDAFAVLSSQLKDRKWELRERTIRAIMDVTNSNPSSYRKAFDILSSLNKDRHFEVRRTAAMEIVEIAKEISFDVNDVVKILPLFRKQVDASGDFLLPKFYDLLPLELIVDVFFHLRDKKVISFVSEKIALIALSVVECGDPNKRVLILDDGEKRMTWLKTWTETREFLRSIQNDVLAKYPLAKCCLMRPFDKYV